MSTGRFLLAFGVYVAALHTVDGPWREWKRGREGLALDPWTLTHVGWGAAARAAGISAGEWFLLGLANEAVELVARKRRPDLLWGEPESPANVGLDLVTNALGWELADLVLEGAA